MIRAGLYQQVLVASAAKTASGNSGVQPFNLRDIEVVIVEVSAITPVTGTTPTLNLYVQQSLDGGATFVDIAALAQATTAVTTATRLRLSAKLMTRADDAIVTGVGDATTTAGQLSGIPLVANGLRIKWVIGGTNPSFTFAVNAYY